MSNQHPHTLPYRSDIDGLRALAILPVVLFHAFPNFLPGGFIGVDIFFVISGYLITNILLNDLHHGSYSIKTFYVRRIKRIFPALICVLVFCLALGWIVLTAVEYRNLGKHLAGGAGFVSNIVLWREAGYFDASGDTKPLLHLWSLGIEEQFYIFWPLIIYWAFKWSWNLRYLIVLIALGSFILNLIWSVKNPTMAFYSPLSRAWELALGAFIAYQAHGFDVQKNQALMRYRNALSVLGFLLIIAGFIFINETSQFPGWWALLPVLGTAFLIMSGPVAYVNRYILTNKFFIGVGLISFSLYLWHWPLLTFARIIYSESPPVHVRATLVILSFILAWITYIVIERPFRKVFNNKSIVLVLVIAMVIVLLSGVAIYKTRGVKHRHAGLLNADPTSLAMGADRNRWLNECGIPLEAKLILKSCYSPKNKIAEYAVWGDSKGEAIYYGLAREADNLNLPGWIMLGNSFPMAGDLPRLQGRNAKKNKYVIDALLANENIKGVLLAPAARSLFSLGEVYSREDLDNSPHYEESLQGVTNAISIIEKSGRQVFFLVDHPGFPDPKSCISGGLTKSSFLNQYLYRKENKYCSMTYEQHLHTNERYRIWLAELKRKNPNIIIYDPTSLVCDITNNKCGISKDGQFLYSYGDHYSDYANSMIARDFFQKLGLINR